jgi:hypothetical protein
MAPCYNPPMPDELALRILRQAHFLRDIDEVTLESVAAGLKPVQAKTGETFLPQGAPADALYFIVEGSVELVHRGKDGRELRLATLSPGDTLGEVELVFRQARQASARAAQPCTLLRWDRAPLAEFMRTHPSALASLRFAAQGRRLAGSIRFHWLADGEVVYAVARKHQALLIQSLMLPLIVLLSAVALGAWAAEMSATWLGWLAAGLGIIGLAFGVWQGVDWGNDYYVVTNRRVVWLEKVVGLYDSRREAPLHTVLSVTLRTDAITRSLGYGDVIIRTYTGQITFHRVGNPQAMAAMVEEHWRRVQIERQQSDRQAMAQSLHEQMSGQPEPDPTAALAIDSQRPTSNVGLDHWSLQVRFEDQGVITYRKHWAVLIQAIWLPSALVLLATGLIGVRLAGWMSGLPADVFVLVLGLILAGSMLWWIYQFVDWANDIYQVTPTQILDITRKPLGEERREVAPLDNILGTEVDRRGIFALVLNFGNVIANVGTTQFVFEGVFDPVGVQQDIIRAQEAVLQRKHETEMGQRREEMVELLQMYHEEIASRRTAQGPDGKS